MTARTAARLAWSLWGVAIVLFAVSVALFVGTADKYAAFDPHLLLIPGFVTVGAVIASRRTSNAIGWLFLALGVLSAVETTSFLYSIHALHARPHLIGAAWSAWLSAWEWSASFALLFFLLLLFPDGRLPSRRWRPVAIGMAVLAGVFVLAGMFQEGPIQVGDVSVWNPAGILSTSGGNISTFWGVLFVGGTAMGAASIVASFFAPAIRFRRGTPEEREQIRWLATVLVIIIIAAAASIVLGRLGFGVLAAVLGVAAVMGLAIGIPVTVGIAIMKYRLYEIDTVIRRGVVVGLLAAFITVVYLAIVVGIGALVGSTRNVTLSIVATAVIAIGFQPIRERARRLADRVVYGQRATPYEVLSRFSERMASSYAADEILPPMARMLADGTAAARAEVWLRRGAELRPAASFPDGIDGDRRAPLSETPAVPGADRAVPVVHRREILGALAITKRPGEPITPAEDKLLSDLAAQAGLVLRNVRLVEDLRASRQRIVAAQDERAKALERNLHDGAQQQLVALSVKLRLAQNLVGRDDERAGAMLDEVQVEASEALDNLRDLAHGIYPPLLADKGLAVALDAQTRKSPVTVAVQSTGTGRYAPEIEAAVYFCCLEALQNVAKYARAQHVELRLSEEDGTLAFSVSDDGVGFDAETGRRGAGLTNMADRLDAIGGTLDVTSAPGSGATIVGRIALISERRQKAEPDIGS